MNPPALVTYLWPSQRRGLAEDLMHAPVVHTGEWQAMDTSASKHHGTHELEDVTIVVPRVPRYHGDLIMPAAVHPLKMMIPADHDWAEEHFAERVSGVPHNPPPSHIRWPYAVGGNVAHMHVPITEIPDDRTTPIRMKFDHTYPERFWPKLAAPDHLTPDDEPHRRGIRFAYGDLGDVVSLLVRSPMTRQAYLPVWFPEDTGAVDQQRVPCTLGYHFMIRNGFLSCRYFIRSCDVYRHLDNDIYLACRLTQWVTDQYNAAVRYATGREFTILPGRMVMHITSLHLFEADAMKLAQKVAIRREA